MNRPSEFLGMVLYHARSGADQKAIPAQRPCPFLSITYEMHL